MKTAFWLVTAGIGIAAGALIFTGTGRTTRAGEERAAEPAKESAAASEEKLTRTRAGLQALYDFRDDSGPVVKDRSGAGEPVDLRIEDMNAVRRSEGALHVHGKTLIRSEKPALRLIQAIRRSQEITIEAWLLPEKTEQSGPARILTLSRDTGARNFTLGQDGDRFDVRLRTTQTDSNGIPSLSSPQKSLAARLTHVVYTRDRRGRARIYLNGKHSVQRTVPGTPSNWDRSYHLGLANELSNDRPWQGTFHLVAIYNRELLPREVRRNFHAGADAATAPLELASRQTPPGAQLFEAHIGALLVKHCLECHDAGTKEGGLDLSQKTAALAGGESGKAVRPGDAEKSLLWQRVESDEMPQDRTPLSPQEKSLLRQWIEEGAVWGTELIDPEAYAGDNRTAERWVQRLTIPEYIETVRSAVGVDIAEEAHRLLPDDLRADGFSNTAYNLGVDLKHVNAYAQLAEMIVDRMDVKAFAGKFTSKRRLSTDDTMREFVADMGKWLLRGPLEEREITVYSGIATTVASAGGDFEEAASYLIEAMLQSPRFIYRIENQRGDGTKWPVSEYELTSRMSYIIWGGPPDEELMRAADSGELYDRGRLEAQVRRMLEDPRAVKRSEHFISEWLNLDRLQNLRPDPERFPDWDPRVAADMREETLAFFNEIVWEQNRPLADLLNAKVTYATPRLAKHYGLPVKEKEKGLKRYDLSKVPQRGGLLTQGSVLTIGGDEASMVTRGLFVLHNLLRGSVKDPPPGLDTTPVPTEPGLSQRKIAEARIADASCGGCHGKFEPLAFGLEKFDGLGTFHEVDEHGNKLRDDGEILFPGTDEPVPYNSSAELMNLLAESDRVRQTLTWKVAQFALGRPLVAADQPELEKIHAAAQKEGGTYAAVIKALITSDLVQMGRTEAAQ